MIGASRGSAALGWLKRLFLGVQDINVTAMLPFKASPTHPNLEVGRRNVFFNIFNLTYNLIRPNSMEIQQKYIFSKAMANFWS